MNIKLRYVLSLCLILILCMSSVYGYASDTSMSKNDNKTTVAKDENEKEPLNKRDKSIKSNGASLDKNKAKSNKESNTIVLKLKDIKALEKLNISEEISTTYDNLDVITIEIPQGADPNEIIAKYKKSAVVEEAYVDEMVQLFYTPTDPYYTSSQWNLKKIKMESAWDSSKGDPSVVVAVIDTGFGPFADVDGVVNGVDVSGSSILEDTYPGQYSYEGSGHGTAVASLITANINNVGIAGIAPNVSLMPVKVFADGSDYTGSAQVAAGIRWAADHGADLINLSLGSDYGSIVEEEAIQYALSKDIMIIAASGNEGYANLISYPAAYNGVIAVGSTSQNDNVSWFSNEGPELDLVAPGESITLPNISIGINYENYSGTSFSSPTVCAIAALVKSEYPSYNNQKVEEILYAGTDDIAIIGWDKTSGHGRINAEKVMNLAANDSNSMFVVDFDSQGGTTIDSMEVPYNTILWEPVDPVRSGYTFGGWYKEASSINPWDFSLDKVTRNTTLYAKWIANPVTPTDFKATSVDPTTIKLTWSPVSEASGYEIYRSTTQTGTYSKVSSPATTSYNDTGLIAGKTYYYKVRAYKLVESTEIYGNFTSVISAKPIPQIPTNVKAASGNSTTIKLTWNTVSGSSGYEIYRATSQTGTYSKVGDSTLSSYNNTGLTVGTTYYYKVKAYKTVDSKKIYGGYSGIVSAKPIPSIPGNVKTVFVNNTTIKLTWGTVSGVTGYEVYRATSKTGRYSLIKDTTATYYNNTKLSSETTYYYKVRAYKTVNSSKVYSSFSNIVSANTIPSTPTSVKASSNSYNSIKISWDGVSGISGYEVYRSTSNTGSYSKVATTTALSYTNSGITTGKTYYYKIRAYKTIGTTKLYSKYSIVVSTKPVPSKPANTKAVLASYNSIKTSWSKVSGASSYQVYRSTSKTGTYSLIKTTTSTSYTDTKLTTNKTYYYKVRAYKTVGKTKIYGEYSSIVSTTTRDPLEPNYSIYSSPDTSSSTYIVGFYLTNNGTKPIKVYSEGSYLIDNDYDSFNRLLQLIHQSTLEDISSIEIPAGGSEYVIFRVVGNPTWYDEKSSIYYEFTYDSVRYLGRASSYYPNYYWEM